MLMKIHANMFVYFVMNYVLAQQIPIFEYLTNSRSEEPTSNKHKSLVDASLARVGSCNDHVVCSIFELQPLLVFL